jgi:Zn-dependent protease with chaperone function
MNHTPPSSEKPVAGRYYDGVSARALSINAWFLPSLELVLQGPEFENRYRAADLRIDATVDDAPRFITLPDGGCCQFAHSALLDDALADWPGRLSRRRHRPRLAHIVGLLLLITLLAWIAVAHVLPFAAHQVALRLPAATMQTLGRDSLKEMDASVFEPSRLPAERRKALLRRSREFLLATGESPERRIEFRDAPQIGPNAMALPSGVIVFTDDLVRLAENDEQLLAVLAHECGHIQHRHALRGLIQESGAIMVITLATGNRHALDTLQADLTASLLSSRYSRDFEFEADAYAAQLLTRARIPKTRLGEMLSLLEKQSSPGKHSALDGYLSSHPATEERLRRLESASP